MRPRASLALPLTLVMFFPCPPSPSLALARRSRLKLKEKTSHTYTKARETTMVVGSTTKVALGKVGQAATVAKDRAMQVSVLSPHARHATHTPSLPLSLPFGMRRYFTRAAAKEAVE